MKSETRKFDEELGYSAEWLEEPERYGPDDSYASDPYRGEAPVAFVVGDVTPEGIGSYSRAHLAPIKVPSRVEVVVALPKDSMGKTLKRELSTRRTG